MAEGERDGRSSATGVGYSSSDGTDTTTSRDGARPPFNKFVKFGGELPTLDAVRRSFEQQLPSVGNSSPLSSEKVMEQKPASPVRPSAPRKSLAFRSASGLARAATALGRAKGAKEKAVRSPSLSSSSEDGLMRDTLARVVGDAKKGKESLFGSALNAKNLNALSNLVEARYRYQRLLMLLNLREQKFRHQPKEIPVREVSDPAPRQSDRLKFLGASSKRLLGRRNPVVVAQGWGGEIFSEDEGADLRSELEKRATERRAASLKYQKDRTCLQRMGVASVFLRRRRSFMGGLGVEFLEMARLASSDKMSAALLKPRDTIYDNVRYDHKSFDTRNLAWNVLYGVLALLLVVLLFLFGMGLGGLLSHVSVFSHVTLTSGQPLKVELFYRNTVGSSEIEVVSVKFPLAVSLTTYNPSHFHMTVSSLNLGLIWLRPRSLSPSPLSPNPRKKPPKPGRGDLEAGASSGHRFPAREISQLPEDNVIAVELPSRAVAEHPFYFNALYLEQLYQRLELTQRPLFTRSTAVKLPVGHGQLPISNVSIILLPPNDYKKEGEEESVESVLLQRKEERERRLSTVSEIEIPAAVDDSIFWSEIANYCKRDNALYFLFHASHFYSAMWVFRLTQYQSHSRPFALPCEFTKSIDAEDPNS